LAEQGLLALSNNTGFIKALNTHQGFITCQPVADALSMLDQYRVYPDEF
jgi:alanine dehydrogenase